ncbi:hypothetical protein M430DRAFT_31817 [Amorphotheca resinae ATCC 22711]|uniref:Uncharacterized protein n=1 Tax=Amorphotheca resinae ATCC 22711 TaxID=857342 RepID=A0A2T3AP47_AMORE|nr:hypothetical protein M430DRAFT_31817 [Amorphotheca resinae ATCC 22711]PSS06699.1 hypothetical protein M430DRAFT_31817 [Amorphotheca resinae ATCC 22711]
MAPKKQPQPPQQQHDEPRLYYKPGFICPKNHGFIDIIPESSSQSQSAAQESHNQGAASEFEKKGQKREANKPKPKPKLITRIKNPHILSGWHGRAALENAALGEVHRVLLLGGEDGDGDGDGDVDVDVDVGGMSVQVLKFVSEEGGMGRGMGRKEGGELVGLGDWEVLMLRALRGVIDGKLGMDEGGKAEKGGEKNEKEEEAQKKKGKGKGKKEKRHRENEDEDGDADEDSLDTPSKKSKQIKR